ncbi:hypothetical protein KIH86_23135 [Paenibacillus sp. HN-1]|uniref:hypothetical protein n=1 Tax=Paenibacillus TaxID=44249 RepID=UPI001CA83230|nr:MULTISPECIES: hypothetical protein [Paenibacillus]MBY9081051.1 hypothetical protein [Paenibacillus sp. CGMCC 1.18879]MBY9087088.1 hypothetical protein [Paenibacillus sinensis]
MTEQEIQEFGQALAERFKQVGDEWSIAERNFRESLYSSVSKRVEVLELERKKDKAKAIYETWSAVTDMLPLDIKRAFIAHYQKIKPTED